MESLDPTTIPAGLSVHIPASPMSSTSVTNSHTKPRELAPFLRQLREMLEREAPTILRWTPDGRAFEILDLHQMTHVVLPKYFKHTKYASFQRQLNYFHFRKWTKSKSPRCTFANPHFVREAPELTWHITRKRDASQRQKLKRQRAQSFDPQAIPRPGTGQQTLSRMVSLDETSRAVSLDRQTVYMSRDRAASESLSYDVDLRTHALRNDGEPVDGLLQWIDDQFPSMASLELLDNADIKPPAWTPYVYQQQTVEHQPASPVAVFLRTTSSV